MSTETLDRRARGILSYLNSHSDFTYATLADAFNQHYKNELPQAMATLTFLSSEGLIKIKTNSGKSAYLIEITHLGATYEQKLRNEQRSQRKKLISERWWNIFTLVLSALISVMINLWME